MAKKINVKNSVVYKNDDSTFNYYGWPSVTRLPDGNLAAAASGFRVEHVCPFGKAVMFISKDEGLTWEDPRVIIDTPLDDRDAGIVAFEGNKVMVTSFNATVDFQYKDIKARPDHPRFDLIMSYLDSVDAKAAEEKYLGSTYRISEDGGYTFGEVKKAPVSSPHGPCVMTDGSLLYIGTAFGEAKIECHKLNKNGNFEYLSTIENIGDEHGPLETVEPSAVVLPNGDIIVHIRVKRVDGINPNVFNTYQSESFDNGKTFSKPHSIGLEHGAPPHIMRHSSGVLLSAYGYRAEPYGQRVMFSKDDGKTWDTDYVLRDDGPTSDLGFPATVELKDGSLLTVYYQQEQGRDNAVIMQSIWEIPEHILNK